MTFEQFKKEFAATFGKMSKEELTAALEKVGITHLDTIGVPETFSGIRVEQSDGKWLASCSVWKIRGIFSGYQVFESKGSSKAEAIGNLILKINEN